MYVGAGAVLQGGEEFLYVRAEGIGIVESRKGHWAGCRGRGDG